MSDLKLRYDDVAGRYVLALDAAGQPALDAGPMTPAITAAMSWGRAKEGDPLPGFSGDVKGWWGDAWAVRGRTGSRWWLLNGRIVNARTLADGKRYLTEALQFLKDQGWVTAVDVDVWRATATTAGASVRLPLAAGKESSVEFELLGG